MPHINCILYVNNYVSVMREVCRPWKVISVQLVALLLVGRRAWWCGGGEWW
jgi:hypothetical protein